LNYSRLGLGIFFIVLVGCANKQQPKPAHADQTVVQAPGEKCENAKKTLEKAVAEGDLDDVRALKIDIELYCIWRRQ
jgi:hypothetical protein